MSTSPQKARKPIDHSKVAKTLKSLGLYAGKTTKLEKKDKDRINRAFTKFRYAYENPTAWKGVKVSAPQAKEWAKRGATVFKDRVMIYAKGYEHIKRTRKGDIILSNAEKSKRFTLETDPLKLKKLAAQHNDQIGIQIGGVSLHRNFVDWEDAIEYATQLRSRFAQDPSKRDLLPMPVFVKGLDDDGDGKE